MTRKESVKKYQQSEKGKAAFKKATLKYRSSKKGKESTKRGSDEQKMRKYLAFVSWFRSLNDDNILEIMKSHFAKITRNNEKYGEYKKKYRERYWSDEEFRQKQIEYGKQYRLKNKENAKR